MSVFTLKLPCRVASEAVRTVGGENMQTFRLLLIFVFLAALGYFAAREWVAPAVEVVTIEQANECDLAAGTCTADLPGGGQLSLEISPRPIPLMQPLRVVARVNGSPLQPSRLDITGLNMEMGLNRTVLAPQGSGRWEGETILPICSQRRMHWQAALALAEGDRQYRLVFRFYTLRP